MATGVVKTVTGKGYGFIEKEDGEDVFYHESTLEGELAERKLRVGDKVEFEEEQSNKGLRAANITLVE
jgi:CspA family cold shock protein